MNLMKQIFEYLNPPILLITGVTLRKVFVEDILQSNGFLIANGSLAITDFGQTYSYTWTAQISINGFKGDDWWTITRTKGGKLSSDPAASSKLAEKMSKTLNPLALKKFPIELEGID
ncbi:MAG: hypothetical protein A2664_03980 [Candidatus Taylorbacteria bacterium RIFCSPHIGHO2_01_FULL_46_22b]|uniref:Uncharacterized protein n=1 Tax=Candidatus Taylorbacteria bacterium RIFCSPHIGHO2_01_FULL_46_22b TaxID=1802301 RepID=A0A1G2M3U6_9BACT|nr:MAG: hypothetical protein A2664_03980 [Candidatus Taylorbacteria bacterium RIFCSPHIGHO2_01_FULL_46_22b]